MLEILYFIIQFLQTRKELNLHNVNRQKAQGRPLLAGLTAAKKIILTKWYNPSLFLMQCWMESYQSTTSLECATAQLSEAKSATAQARAGTTVTIRDYLKRNVCFLFFPQSTDLFFGLGMSASCSYLLLPLFLNDYDCYSCFVKVLFVVSFF